MAQEQHRWARANEAEDFRVQCEKERLECLLKTDYSVRTNPSPLARDYSEYPRGTVSHSEKVPTLTCSGCSAQFDTDARRCYNGTIFYRNVNELILWVPNARKYFCVAKCHNKVQIV